MVEQPDDATLIFRESGAWQNGDGPRLNFRNVFRWTLDPSGDRLRLEHLRFGAERPVYLFDLVPVIGGGLESAEPHACRDDQYAANLVFDSGEVRLYWKIIGPAKDSEVNYVYRHADE